MFMFSLQMKNIEVATLKRTHRLTPTSQKLGAPTESEKTFTIFEEYMSR